MGLDTRHVFIIDAIVSLIFNFPLKIFAADKMKIALCLAVLIAVAVSAPGTWDNFGKTLDRTVNDFLSGGGDCLRDTDCNAYLGYCHPSPIPSCKPTPLAYGLVVAAILFIVSVLLCCCCICCCSAATGGSRRYQSV